MSFIDEKKGVVHAAGWFLARGDESVKRETRQFAASSALAVTDADGGKHIPMGTAYPTNDAYAVGIAYEDVDVSSGDMAGSVVVNGAVVYEDRLAVTGAQYDAVTLKDLVSPKANGWQERSGTVGSYTYANSTDETVNTSKTYYLPDDDHTAVTNYAAELDPSAKGWYESDGGTGYDPSTDTVANTSKTYYAKSDVRLASAAKSALEALGFVFVTSAPAVTRPY